MSAAAPTSPSLILRATHIVAVRVESADAAAWRPRQPSGEERSVSLGLKLEEVVKGRVRQRVGDSIRVDARQVRIRFVWTPMPGVWSNASIEPGTRLVAFSQSDGDDAAVLLVDPACLQLIDAADALVDVQLAARAENEHLALGPLLTEARAAAPSLRWLFADYLWARHQTEALRDIGAFDRIARFLEDPNLAPDCRTTLVMTLSTAVDAPEPPALAQIDRLAIAFFRLLAAPQAQPLHDNLIGTYLPNLLGITGGGEKRTAAEVFEKHPGERERAAQMLGAYRGSEPVEPLLDWLRS